MNICLSYIGKLPDYIVDCIYQIRLFTKMNIYLIMNDIKSPHLLEIQKYDVILIQYKDVYSSKFNECIKQNSTKIQIIDYIDREELFLRSIERFYILQNTMILNDLSDVLFMEIDNLIYDDPCNWLLEFQKNDICYMFDNYDRCSSGIMYIKNKYSMTEMLDSFIDFINNSKNEHINEMSLLYKYFISNTKTIKLQILPTFWNDCNMLDIIKQNYEKYDSIFDAAALGIMLFGTDSYLLQNSNFHKDFTKEKWWPSYIDYTNYNIKWFKDDKNRLIPYINNGEKWIKINNLHIHSKNLYKALSNTR